MHYIVAGLKRIHTLIHLIFLKILYGKQFKFLWGGVIDYSSHVVIQDKGRICIGRKIGVRRRCEFSVSEEGIIEIGERVFFNNNCMVVAHNHIKIGDRTRFGPNVLIFDHDYEYKDRESFLSGRHNTSSIMIGKNCWIGAGTILLRGTIIGDDCVIGAGCVIKGKYPKGSLVVQKREERVSDIREGK